MACWYLPAAQESHIVEFFDDCAVPPSQSVQLLWPDPLLYLPASHTAHDDDAGPLYLPDWQMEQLDAEAPLYVPESQGTQLEAPSPP